MHSSEQSDKYRNLGHQKLHQDSQSEGKEHQPVCQMVHAKDRGFGIAHADCMKQLGHAEYRKGIGLAFCQKLWIGKSHPDLFRGKRLSRREKLPDGDLQKRRQTDQRYQDSVKNRAGAPASGKQAFRFRPGRPLHIALLPVHINSESQSREGIRDQIDPQDMTWLQRGRKDQKKGGHHGQDLPKIGGQKKNNRLSDIFINSPAQGNSFLNGREVVVCQNQVCRIPCHIRSAAPHGDSHIGCLQRGGIIHAITGHGHRFAAFLQCLYDPDLMLRRHMSKNPDPRKRPQKSFLIHERQRFTRKTLPPLSGDSQFLCEGKGRILSVTGDHHCPHAGIPKGFHGRSRLRAEWILHTGKA